MSRTFRKNPKDKFLRNPRTQQERSIAELHRKEGAPVRAKRNRKNLPTNYDDKVIAALYEKVET